MMEMQHFKQFSTVKNGVKIVLNFDKFNPLFKQAQTELDTMIMTSMIPYMPLQTGDLRRATQAESMSFAGTGIVFAAVPPYGRYQYMGVKMVDSATGKGPMKIPTVGYRFHKGAKLVATDIPLKYSQPMARARWFEVAKDAHLNAWVKKVQDIIGGGLGA